MFEVGVHHYLVLSALLFTIGILGVLLRKNILVILMSIALMLNAVNITFVAFARFMNDLDGQIVVFFVKAIAASEVAIGLTIAILVFKKFKGVHIRLFENLKG